jgi:hypothetical protein
LLVALTFSSALGAQALTLRIVGPDSEPVPFAWVSTNGAAAQIADAAGTLHLNLPANKTLAVEVRRIGYQPWTGRLTGSDSVRTITALLGRAVQ